MPSLEQQGFEVIPGILDAAAVSSLLRAVLDSRIPRSRAGMRGGGSRDCSRSTDLDTRTLGSRTASLSIQGDPLR
jgi:hypothetical protein